MAVLARLLALPPRPPRQRRRRRPRRPAPVRRSRRSRPRRRRGEGDGPHRRDKALAELGIPIDHVGGSSIGAIVGGQAAMGWTWDQMLAYDEREWTSRWLRFDLTLPTVSVSSGRRARRMLEDTFGPLAHRGLPPAVLLHDRQPQPLPPRRPPPRTGGPVDARQRQRAGAVAARGRRRGRAAHRRRAAEQRPGRRHAARHRGPIIAVDVCAVQSRDDGAYRRRATGRDPPPSPPPLPPPLPEPGRHAQPVRPAREPAAPRASLGACRRLPHTRSRHDRLQRLRPDPRRRRDRVPDGDGVTRRLEPGREPGTPAPSIARSPASWTVHGHRSSLRPPPAATGSARPRPAR